MILDQRIILKNGNEAWLRNGDASDGKAAYDNFNATHAETDFLLSYPDKTVLILSRKDSFLEKKQRA